MFFIIDPYVRSRKITLLLFPALIHLFVRYSGSTWIGTKENILFFTMNPTSSFTNNLPFMKPTTKKKKSFFRTKIQFKYTPSQMVSSGLLESNLIMVLFASYIKTLLLIFEKPFCFSGHNVKCEI